MKQERVNYALDRIAESGIPIDSKMGDELLAKMETGVASFALNREYGKQKKEADVALLFNKGKESSLYFFNDYRISALNNGQLCNKTFSASAYKGKKMQLHDAIKLTQGKSIYQAENKSYIKLNPYELTSKGEPSIHQYSENYGGDVEVALRQYPIINLEKHMPDHMERLKKGETIDVKFQVGSNQVDYKIDYNAQFKSLDVYRHDTGMKLTLKDMHHLRKNSTLKKGIEKESEAKEMSVAKAAQNDVEVKPAKKSTKSNSTAKNAKDNSKKSGVAKDNVVKAGQNGGSRKTKKITH